MFVTPAWVLLISQADEKLNSGESSTEQYISELRDNGTPERVIEIKLKEKR